MSDDDRNEMTDPDPIQSVGTLQAISKAELDVQISTAKAYPRSIKRFRDECLQMATLSEDIAEECIYALPRGRKTIEGPSVRLAEIVASAWGNCRAGARIVDEDDNFITAQGMFYDLERNVGIQYDVRRRITDRNGRRFNTDMVGVTGNAACAIALRNAIFKGVPKAFWADIYQAAIKCAIGDSETLSKRRTKALDYFGKLGATREMVYARLGVEGEEDITLEHLLTLTGFKNAIKEGEATVDSVFTKPAAEANGKTRSEALSDKLGGKDKKGSVGAPEVRASRDKSKAKEAEADEDKSPDDPDAIVARFEQVLAKIDDYARKGKRKKMKVLQDLEAAVGMIAMSWDLAMCDKAEETLERWALEDSRSAEATT